MICPKCRDYHWEGDSYCGTCGTQLIEVVCGCGNKNLTAHNEFCPKCGERVGEKLRARLARAYSNCRVDEREAAAEAVRGV